MRMPPWEIENATDPRIVRWLLLDDLIAEFEAVTARAGG